MKVIKKEKQGNQNEEGKGCKKFLWTQNNLKIDEVVVVVQVLWQQLFLPEVKKHKNIAVVFFERQ